MINNYIAEICVFKFSFNLLINNCPLAELNVLFTDYHELGFSDVGRK